MKAMGEPVDSQVPACTWRIRITKTGATKYMSHLDFARTIERAVRRAELPLVLSGGFNPRLRMSFSPALPVGVSSNSEFVDILLKESVDANEASLGLNESLPEGMRVTSSRMLPPDIPALSAIIQAASYRLDLYGKMQVGLDCVLTGIERILTKDSILVERITPKGIQRVDIRPLIYEMRVDTHNSFVSVHATVASGSQGNVRPFDLAKVILESAGIDEGGAFVDITRDGLYTLRDGKLCLPWYSSF
jgi:radical SAM-linked protein